MARNAWGEMFSGGHALASITLVSGVGLQAMELFIGSTLLPSVVRDIGGLDLFSWNTTVFIVASILASIFAAVRPFGLGPRGLYVFSALTFGLGGLVCGLAPGMEIMLVGRALQGFGGGLLTALSYSTIRLMFPQALWGTAFALISTVWGVATIIGPAIGGIFAGYGEWRLAFFVLVPCSLLIGLLALKVVPRASGETGMASPPLVQIGLLIGAVAAMSLAAILTSNLALQWALIGLSVLAVILFGVLDQRRQRRLFPTSAFTPGGELALLYAVMLLVNLAIVCDMFAPLFLQTLHGQPPLIAGYMLALVAVGWSTGSVWVSNWTGRGQRAVLMIGPALQLVGLVVLAVFMSRHNPAGSLPLLVTIGIGLFMLGAGVGISWPHVSACLLRSAPKGEGDVTSASISIVQLFASGFGAAVAGVIANAAGLSSGDVVTGAITASSWVFWSFALVPVVTLPIVIAYVRTALAPGSALATAP